MTESLEILHVLGHLQTVLADLAVRGLRAAGASQRAALAGVRTELERVGANHLAARGAALMSGLDKGDRTAATALLRAQASVRVFERVLTLETAATLLAGLAQPRTGESTDGGGDT